MSALEVLAVLAAGLAAGTINTVVGSGTLITFPTLLAIGLPPVLANVSNTVGLVFGSISGSWGYRRELVGQGRRALVIGSASLLGAIGGAVALLALPEGAFRAIVPVFIAIALVLIVLQPQIGPWVHERRGRARLPTREDVPDPGSRVGPGAWLAVMAAGAYGGYFGAAQGILLLGVLGLALPDDLQRLNALKNVLATIANGVAAIVFIAVSEVDWLVAGLIAVSAIVGGQVGARWGRRLPDALLRAVIVVVGVVAMVQLLAG
jgi:uncharacterized protein